MARRAHRTESWAFKKSYAETRFFAMATRKGMEVIKGGWPDFACFRNGKLVVVVEVKEKKHRLQPHQLKLLDGLRQWGIPAYVWIRGDGFVKAHPRLLGLKFGGQKVKTWASRYCGRCGAKFEPTSGKQVYCSVRCRMNAWHQKYGRKYREPEFDGLGMA